MYNRAVLILSQKQPVDRMVFGDQNARRAGGRAMGMGHLFTVVRLYTEGDAGLADSSGGCRYIGNSTLKRTVVPREGALSIEISPPISLTSRWQIERPRPVPP